MKAIAARARPVYHGREWVDGTLPTETEAWPKFESRRIVDASGDDDDLAREELRAYAAGKPWVWPDRTHYFLCDVHADTDAFFCSLVASGGVAKTGPEDHAFELTDEGRAATFVIGGDFFDKGPSNLRLLDALRMLIDRGADVDVLAGNHDVRALLGLVHAGRKDTLLAHLFVRMGKKAAPLFHEIHERYLRDTPGAASELSAASVRQLLFPPASWYRDFPAAAAEHMPAGKVEREVVRIREKARELEAECAELGLTLPMVHAAALQARRLFCDADGEYRWFFDRMKLARRAGSFLFIHGGVDDSVARILWRDGVAGLNAEFRRLMSSDLFELYHGPLGNTFRTKYRVTDLPLTRRGIAEMYRAGLYAVIHGHQNVLRGPHMLLRNGLLNFECDASLNRNTRIHEGLRGAGGAVTILHEQGFLQARSTDYPYAKTLDASAVLGLMSIV